MSLHCAAFTGGSPCFIRLFLVAVLAQVDCVTCSSSFRHNSRKLEELEALFTAFIVAHVRNLVRALKNVSVAQVTRNRCVPVARGPDWLHPGRRRAEQQAISVELWIRQSDSSPVVMVMSSCASTTQATMVVTSSKTERKTHGENWIRLCCCGWQMSLRRVPARCVIRTLVLCAAKGKTTHGCAVDSIAAKAAHLPDISTLLPAASIHDRSFIQDQSAVDRFCLSRK